MARTVEEIKDAVHFLEHGHHGDADMRSIGYVLGCVVADAVNNEEEPQGLICAGAEGMKDTLDLFLAFLDSEGHHPIFRPRLNDGK